MTFSRILALGGDILALVGSRTVEQLYANLKVIGVTLSKDDPQQIEQIILK